MVFVFSVTMMSICLLRTLLQERGRILGTIGHHRGHTTIRLVEAARVGQPRSHQHTARALCRIGNRSAGSRSHLLVHRTTYMVQMGQMPFRPKIWAWTIALEALVTQERSNREPRWTWRWICKISKKLARYLRWSTSLKRITLGQRRRWTGSIFKL